jgi:hypothetical protein
MQVKSDMICHYVWCLIWGTTYTLRQSSLVVDLQPRQLPSYNEHVRYTILLLSYLNRFSGVCNFYEFVSLSDKFEQWNDANVERGATRHVGIQ